LVIVMFDKEPVGSLLAFVVFDIDRQTLVLWIK
jgi:hypothetical protein